MNERNFKIRNWSDLIAVSTLITMFLAVVLWGLKLESELNVERQVNTQQAREIAKLEAQVGTGILPRAEERIDDLEKRLDRLEE